jgi:alpha-galactosidase
MFQSGTLISTCLFTFLCIAEGTNNGMAPTPPMGWRSWLPFHANINDRVIRNMVDAVTSRSRLVDGRPTSLADLGYGRIGIDDAWQACGTGWQGTFHAKDGTPLVNSSIFPDLKALVDYAHGKDVKMGWYSINCQCMDTYKIQHNADKEWASRVYAAEVKLIQAAGFDGVKIDNCGDVAGGGKGFVMMVDNINKSGRPLLIENCNQGKAGNARGVPTKPNVECPGNLFRTGGDPRPDFGIRIRQLQKAVPFLDVDHPISRPDCWAYPGTLEVGNFPGKDMYAQSRTEFGAWATISSPLILGFDLADKHVTDKVWDIITNREAIAINQAWAGHPGRLLQDATSHQVWTKKLGNDEHAIFVFNRHSSKIGNVAVPLSQLGLRSTCTVRDIWARKDRSPVKDTWHTGPLDAYDSVFIRLKSGDAPSVTSISNATFSASNATFSAGTSVTQ